jgi:hypothetical protein
MWPAHTPLVDRLIQRAAEQYPRIISCYRSLSFWKFCQGAAPWLLRVKPQPKKKADMVKHPEAFNHVGLLCNEPPGQSGLLFILSSDDSHSSFPRSRLPLLASFLIPYIVPRGSAIASKMSCASSYYASLDTYRRTIRCGSERAREVGG